MLLNSYAHIDCILNGNRIYEWADTDQPYAIEKDEVVEIEVTHDGHHHPMSKANLGGYLILKLVPFSRSVKWLLEMEADRHDHIRNRSAIPYYNGILQDFVTGNTVSLERGVVIQIPSFPTPGMAFEVKFDFQLMSITVSNDGWRSFGEYPDFQPKYKDNN